MSTVAVSRVIDAPVDDVWRVFTHLAGRCAWLSTVTRVEIVEPGPFGTGTIWRESRTMPDGDEVTEEFRVSECEPPRRFVVVSPGIGADYRMTYTFEPVHDRRHPTATDVTVVQEGSPTAPAGRLLALVFGGLAARTVEGALRRDLDDLAETATGGSAAA
jgi:uncharacterized membrane protein